MISLFEYLKSSNINRFTFKSYSKGNSQTLWQGNASGSVKASILSDNQIVFDEQGLVNLSCNSKPIHFTNTYIFEHNKGDTITIFHARFGFKNRVKLLDLEYQSNNIWIQQDPHLCDKDKYYLTAEILRSKIKFDWTIKGPKKDECIQYLYYVN